MEKIIVSGEYFNVADTLNCGQVFRYEPHKKGFLVHSGEKSCYAYNENGCAVVECETGDAEYFHRYFDLDADYAAYVKAAEGSGVKILQNAAAVGKGIRILNQNAEETVISFIVSQNNRIPRIRAILNRLSEDCGGKHAFGGERYPSFPSAETLAARDKSYFSAAGLGYRDEYVLSAAKALSSGAAAGWAKLSSVDLKSCLCNLKGVGDKVAACIALFAFHRFDVFPADTWMVKLYKEDFGGTEKDAKKIAAYFAGLFGKNAGIFQQYMFHYKRNKKE